MWLYHLCLRTLGPLARVYFRVQPAKPGHVPTNDGLIVAANHSSFLDPWLLGLGFPRPLRYLMTREWYERSIVWRAFFRAHGTIPADERRFEVTLSRVLEALEQDQAVGMFPEGGISHDGRIGRFRTGTALLAARSGAPVLPVGIRGAFETLPRHRRWPTRHPVELHVGDALRFDGAPIEQPARARLLEFRDRLQAEICRLAGKDRS